MPLGRGRRTHLSVLGLYEAKSHMSGGDPGKGVHVELTENVGLDAETP